jgi:dGTPase
MKKVPDMLEGNYNGELLKDINKKKELKKIKKKDRKDVYTEQSAVFIEAAGYEVIGGLLETFLRSVEEIAYKGDNASPYAQKILQLIPRQFKNGKDKVDNDIYTRIIKITDYVSGMTDSFAVSTYKKIKGITLPHPG